MKFLLRDRLLQKNQKHMAFQLSQKQGRIAPYIAQLRNAGPVRSIPDSLSVFDGAHVAIEANG